MLPELKFKQSIYEKQGINHILIHPEQLRYGSLDDIIDEIGNENLDEEIEF